MRKIKYLAFLPLLGLSACGGGGGGGSDGANRDVAPTRPSAQVSGTGFDGLILDGDVAVNGFNGAVVGSLLGTARTDSIGRYTTSVQSPDTSIVVKIDGGRYIEEASGTEIQLDRRLGLKLFAVDFYKSGSAIEVSATFFTTLATGLTEYLVQRQGLSTEVAIERAYSELDAWAGFNTRRTTPLAVNDAANASPLLTNALKAGFVAAGISQLTRAVGNNEPHTTFSSIGFIQVAYEDIKADGVLDGVGNGGNPLSYGTLPITGDTYRTLLATRLLQFVSSSNNQTSLDFDDLVGYASELNSYNGELFNYTASPDINESYPTITRVLPSSDTAQAHQTELRADVSDIFGIRSVQFALNGNVVATVDAAPYTYALDLSQYSNGTYELTAITTNYLGNQSEARHNIMINNGELSINLPGSQRDWMNLQDNYHRANCPFNFRLNDSTGFGAKIVKLNESVLLQETDIPGGSMTVSSSIGFSDVRDNLSSRYMRGEYCRVVTVSAHDRLNNVYIWNVAVTRRHENVGGTSVNMRVDCSYRFSSSC